MNKPCMTCNIKETKNGIFKAHLEEFADKNLPKDNKLYENKHANKITISNLNSNKTIFYFATNERDFTKSIQPRVIAYDNLKNSGVVKVNNDGEAIVYLKCPQLYVNNNEKIYSRHMHFLYWDNEKKMWNKNLYTRQILCNVNEKFVKDNIRKSVIIDARPLENYNKSHIKGSINLPYNIKWTEKSVLEELKKRNEKYDMNKLVPIIIYCSEGCNASNLLYDKLNKLGFYNIMHAEGNLLSLR
jgi:rhodanese-related sulfurtransferase